MPEKLTAIDHKRVVPPGPPAMSAKLYRARRGGDVELRVYLSDGVLWELGILPTAPGRFFHAGGGVFVWDVAESVKGVDWHKSSPAVDRLQTEHKDHKGKVWFFELGKATAIWPGIQGTVKCDVDIIGTIVHAERLRFKIIPKTLKK